MNIEEIPNYAIGEIPDDLPDENPPLYRLVIAKRALHAGYECADEDVEACVTDMIADLRHLCDALGIDYYACESSAYGHYTAEKPYNPWFRVESTKEIPQPECNAEGGISDPSLSTWICPTCSEKVHDISFRHIAECGIPYCSECDEDMHLCDDPSGYVDNRKSGSRIAEIPSPENEGGAV
jgi:hypothetical protein